MTVVVADTSPLNYLALIGSIDLLRLLYGRVLVPQQVVLELTDLAAPDAEAGSVNSSRMRR
jgi:predicted nucleic acid-binding protein